MAFILEPAKDLRLSSKACRQQWNFWRSEGDDPAFLLSKTGRRQEWLILDLIGKNATMDAKFYVKRGRRYREEDAIAPPESVRYMFVIESAAGGKPPPLRFDPCSFIGEFWLTYREFIDITPVQEMIETTLNQFPDTHVEFISWKKASSISDWLTRGLERWLRPPVRSHATQLYAQAEQELAAVTAPIGAPPWLSVVVPTYNTPPRYLDDIIESFRRQRIGGVELVFSDDGSTSSQTLAWLDRVSRQPSSYIKVVQSFQNGGISTATNLGINEATGTWVALLDHDDVFAPAAFKAIFKCIEQNPAAKFIYTDTLIVRQDLSPKRYILKPAYDPILLSGMNYINHFSIFRRDCLARLGPMRPEMDGSQDYDLLLRYLSHINETEILHLPFPAYWWRRHKKSFSHQHMDIATNNARKALVAHFASRQQAVTVENAETKMFHKVVFNRPTGGDKKVSVIIPNRNCFDLIQSLLHDLFNRTDYPSIEVIVIDNGSTDDRVLRLYRSYNASHSNFIYEVNEEPFNFSRSINRGYEKATGELLLLLNNDVEIIESGWLLEMVSCFSYENVGIVGAKLLYPNDTIQHAGVIVGFGGLAGHWYHGKSNDFGGHTNRLHVRNSMTCVTGAVMLISRQCADAVGRWDEDNFAVAYNDVDYCLRAFNLRYRIVWTPFARLYHHESISRGSDRSPANRLRFEREKANLKRLHGTGTFSDPASNPFFSINSSDPRLRQCAHLPAARSWFRPKE